MSSNLRHTYLYIWRTLTCSLRDQHLLLIYRRHEWILFIFLVTSEENVRFNNDSLFARGCREVQRQEWSKNLDCDQRLCLRCDGLHEWGMWTLIDKYLFNLNKL